MVLQTGHVWQCFADQPFQVTSNQWQEPLLAENDSPWHKVGFCVTNKYSIRIKSKAGDIKGAVEESEVLQSEEIISK